MHDGLDVLPLPEDLQTCVGLILDRKDRNLLSHNRDVVVPGIPKRVRSCDPPAPRKFWGNASLLFARTGSYARKAVPWLVGCG